MKIFGKQIIRQIIYIFITGLSLRLLINNFNIFMDYTDYTYILYSLFTSFFILLPCSIDNYNITYYQNRNLNISNSSKSDLKSDINTGMNSPQSSDKDVVKLRFVRGKFLARNRLDFREFYTENLTSISYTIKELEDFNKKFNSELAKGINPLRASDILPEEIKDKYLEFLYNKYTGDNKLIPVDNKEYKIKPSNKNKILDWLSKT